jgi:hypothetical protein
MPTNLTPRPPHKAAHIAQRLRAHARLCEQVALESWSEDTAAMLLRVADDCNRAATEIAKEEIAHDNPAATRH